MSPVVPPISVMTTSGLVTSAIICKMAVLNLIRDMWDDLDGFSEIIAAPFLYQAQSDKPDRWLRLFIA